MAKTSNRNANNEAGSDSSAPNGSAHPTNNEDPMRSIINPLSQLITIKLEEDNFLIWKFQVENMILGYGLEDFIHGTCNLIGCSSSQQIWAIIEQLFNNLSMREYILKMKSYFDMLGAANHNMTDTDQILALLNGLGDEYESIVAIICSREIPYTLQHVNMLILSHEALIATARNTATDKNWYPDSGATNHVTNDIQNLSYGTNYNGTQKIHMGNGKGLSIKHIVVNKILSHCNVNFSINKMQHYFCTACQMGKSHKLPFPTSQTIYSAPLQLVEADIWGPSPILSTTSHKFYITFVDIFSRFTWIYFLKRKSEALDCFIYFKTQVENQLNTKIKIFQNDWGGEFRSFSNFLDKYGIIHRVSCPHTSQQNGIVERKHRHVVELGLTLLAQFSVPKPYWPKAFSTAV
ncbi:hypothetical protein UlMin_007250 [Ulmus minor]